MEVEKSGLLVDALPYIDHGYDEAGVREAVSREYIRIDIGISVNLFSRHWLWLKKKLGDTDPRKTTWKPNCQL